MDSIFKNKVFLVSAFVIVWIVGYFVGVAWFGDSNKLAKPKYTEAGVLFLPEPRNLPPEVILTNHHGEQFKMSDFKGKWSLVFFGYTFCPDICPVTLVDLRDLRQKMPTQTLEKLQIFMVSVDPYRDNPAHLKEYLGYFESDFMGLTGDMEQIKALSKRVSIPFIEPDISKEFYTVDHSGNLAILNPDGKQVGFVRAPFEIDNLAEVFPHLFK